MSMKILILEIIIKKLGLFEKSRIFLSDATIFPPSKVYYFAYLISLLIYYICIQYKNKRKPREKIPLPLSFLQYKNISYVWGYTKFFS